MGHFQSVGFEITQRKVTIRGGYFSDHRDEVDFKIVVIIKGEIIGREIMNDSLIVL